MAATPLLFHFSGQPSRKIFSSLYHMNAVLAYTIKRLYYFFPLDIRDDVYKIDGKIHYLESGSAAQFSAEVPFDNKESLYVESVNKTTFYVGNTKNLVYFTVEGSKVTPRIESIGADFVHKIHKGTMFCINNIEQIGVNCYKRTIRIQNNIHISYDKFKNIALESTDKQVVYIFVMSEFIAICKNIRYNVCDYSQNIDVLPIMNNKLCMRQTHVIRDELSEVVQL